MFPGVGVDPAQLAAMQNTTRHIKGIIRIDYKTNKIEVSLNSELPEASDLIPQLLSQLSEQLAVQLASFMKIEGEIVEIGKSQ